MVTKGWRQTSLGEVVRLQRGHDLPEQERREGSVPVMGSFGHTGWHNEAKAKGPGVTIGRSGASIGVVSYVEEDYWPLNTSLLSLRPAPVTRSSPKISRIKFSSKSSIAQSSLRGYRTSSN